MGEDMVGTKVYSIEPSDYNKPVTITGTLDFSSIDLAKVLQTPARKYSDYVIRDPNEIVFVDVIVENKVTEVTFGDGKKEKMVLQEPDVFCMEDCLYIALAKHLYKQICTFEGIECKAKELRNYKYYAKIVNNGLKLWKKIKKFQEEEKLEEERIKKRKEKKEAYKKKRAEKRKEELISIQKEAYIRALKELRSVEEM